MGEKKGFRWQVYIPDEETKKRFQADCAMKSVSMGFQLDKILNKYLDKKITL